MTPVTPSSACPCCSPPFEYGDFTRAWTHMKLSNNGQQVIWLGDHGATLTNLMVDAPNSRMYIGSGSSLGFASTAYRRSNIDLPTSIWTQVNSQNRTASLAVGPNGDIAVGLIDTGVHRLQRRDSDGALIWQTATTTDSIDAVVFDSSGNLYLSRFISPSATPVPYLDKYDTSGALVWTQINPSGTGSGLLNDRALAANGTQLCAVGTRNFSAITTRVLDITTTPTSGVYSWTANHGNTVFAAAWMPNGNLVTGGNRDLALGSGMTTRCYSSTGTLLWSADHGSGVRGVAVDNDNNVYTTGVYTSGATTRKYDSSGTLLWSHDYTLGNGGLLGGNGSAIGLDTDGYVYVGGTRFAP